MSNDQAKGFIQQAGQSIQSGQYAQALELVDQAIAIDPMDPEAHVLRGVALSSTNQPDAAVESFRRAIGLDPQNTKAFFNLAIHYYRIGQKAEALEMAREVVNQDPTHTGARELVTRIEAETNAHTTVAGEGGEQSAFAAPPAPGAGAQYRPGYDEKPVHTIGFIERMGKNWTVVGWILSGLQALFFFFSIAQAIQLWQKMLTDPASLQQPGANQSMMMMPSTPVEWVMAGASLMTLLLTFVWMILDITDRRTNWLWILPFVILCCCCNGLHWVILAIYIIAGRK